MIKGRNAQFGLNKSPSDLETRATTSLPTRVSVILALTSLFTSLTFSFTAAGLADAAISVSWAACVLCAVVMFMTSNRFSQAIWKTIALGLALSLFSYPIIPAMLFGSVISVGAISALICSAKKQRALIPILLPIISYAISLAATSDPLLSLSALIIYLPALPMGLTSRRGASMTSTILSCAAVIFAMLAGFAALILYAYYGNVSVEAANALIDDFTALSIYYSEQSFAQLGYIEFDESMKKTLILSIDAYVNAAVGIVMALSACASYAALRLQHNLFSAYGLDKHLSPKATTLTVSPAASAIFAIAHVMSFAVDSTNRISITGVVCANICIALAPGLAVMGIKAIKALPLRFGIKGVLISIAIVAAIIFLFATSPLLLPLVGAICVIIEAVDLWAKDFYGKGERQ